MNKKKSFFPFVFSKPHQHLKEHKTEDHFESRQRIVTQLETLQVHYQELIRKKERLSKKQFIENLPQKVRQTQSKLKKVEDDNEDLRIKIGQLTNPNSQTKEKKQGHGKNSKQKQNQKIKKAQSKIQSLENELGWLKLSSKKEKLTQLFLRKQEKFKEKANLTNTLKEDLEFLHSTFLKEKEITKERIYKMNKTKEGKEKLMIQEKLRKKHEEKYQKYVRKLKKCQFDIKNLSEIKNNCTSFGCRLKHIQTQYKTQLKERQHLCNEILQVRELFDLSDQQFRLINSEFIDFFFGLGSETNLTNSDSSPTLEKESEENSDQRGKKNNRYTFKKDDHINKRNPHFRKRNLNNDKEKNQLSIVKFNSEGSINWNILDRKMNYQRPSFLHSIDFSIQPTATKHTQNPLLTNPNEAKEGSDDDEWHEILPTDYQKQKNTHKKRRNQKKQNNTRKRKKRKSLSKIKTNLNRNNTINNLKKNGENINHNQNINDNNIVNEDLNYKQNDNKSTLLKTQQNKDEIETSTTQKLRIKKEKKKHSVIPKTIDTKALLSRRQRKKPRGYSVVITKQEKKEHPFQIQSLSKLLTIPMGIAYFHDFLSENLNQENLMFWQEVKSFKQNCFTQKQIRKTAKKIIIKFIQRESLFEINIASKCRTQILQHLETKEFPIWMFDEAHFKVFDHMNLDLFGGFQFSHYYKTLLKKLQKDSTIDLNPSKKKCTLQYRGKIKNALNDEKVIIKENKNAYQVAEQLLTTILDIIKIYHNVSSNTINMKQIGRLIPFRKFVNQTTKLKQVDLTKIDRNERLCFFLNIFNTLALHSFIVNGIPKDKPSIEKFMKNSKYIINKDYYSLNDILHGVLRNNQSINQKKHGRSNYFVSKNDNRAQFALGPVDPRIHFCLINNYCRSFVRIYRKKGLNELLNITTKTILENIITTNDKNLILPKFFNMYSQDFGNKNWIIKWTYKHLRNKLPQNGNKVMTIKYSKKIRIPQKIRFDFQSSLIRKFGKRETIRI
ncbi:electron carrier/ protein disulfide oxidoreductase [Anaeramoeba flamelloides]|uniref:Electron carrier/ protein disulfide oxidoreductase n=1 Tax=Anaeramoeba flamelloides TaxID=1746091 RepID=A0AAV8A0X7_9EUKA|nr:electron carrier/ protein disulfide oxidoreductase [Anaeramoeba flamelloides]